MMGPGMEVWLLIMILAMTLILPTMLALWWQGRNRAGLAPKAKRKRREGGLSAENIAPDRDDLAHLEAKGVVRLEDDGELPELTADDLYLDEKPKRTEDDF